MKKDIRDYLHLYLGCEVVTPDGIGWLASVSRDRRKMDGLMLSNVVKVDFRKIILTKNSVDGFDKKRNYGHYLISSESYVGLDQPDGTEPEFSMPGGIKLFLRPLSSMTEEEKKEFIFICGLESEDISCLQIEFDILTCTGLLGTAHLTNVLQWAKGINYLRKKAVDVDELIDAGLALDITKQPAQ